MYGDDSDDASKTNSTVDQLQGSASTSVADNRNRNDDEDFTQEREYLDESDIAQTSDSSESDSDSESDLLQNAIYESDDGSLDFNDTSRFYEF
jgi:hypothetical protein